MIRLISWIVITLIVAGILLAPLLPSRVEQANANLNAVLRAAEDIDKRSALPESVVKARDKVSALMAQPQTPTGQYIIKSEDVFEAMRLIHSAEADLNARSAALAAESAEIATRGADLIDGLPKSDWTERLKSVLEAGKDLVATLIWPALAASVLYFAFTAKGQDRFREFAKFIKTFKIGSLELEVWGQEAKETQEAAMQKFRKSVQEEFDKLAAEKEISKTVTRILTEKVEPKIKDIHNQELIGYRATIHVEDLLLKNAYYQLIDYLPSGGDRGRAFSVRYGMVGRCWRRNKSDCLPVVKAGDDLVEKWGMTPEEANRPHTRQTMLCCVLKDSAGGRLAVFYIDAAEQKALGEADKMQEIAELVEAAAKSYGLTAALEAISQAASMKKAEALELYGKRA